MLQITWQMKQNGNFVGPLKLTPCGSLSAGGMSQVRLASETRPTSGVKLRASPPSASWGTPVSSPSMTPVTTAADSASNGEFPFLVVAVLWLQLTVLNMLFHVRAC